MGKKLLLIPIWILLFIPATLLGQCPSTVSISSNSGNNICENTNVTFTATPSNDATGTLSYQWQINGSNVGSNSTNFTTNSLNNGDNVRVVVTTDADASCFTNSNTIQMTVNQNRVASVSIQASNNDICPGENISFTISSSANLGANPTYSWKRIRGGNTTEVGSSSNLTTSDIQTNDQFFLEVNSVIPCTTPIPAISNSINTNVKPAIPAQPGTISGADTVCPSTSQTYSVTAVTNATEYEWNLPAGWTGSSTTNSITVTPGANGGTLSVAAKNECGASADQVLNVTVLPDTPNTPGSISGLEAVCPAELQTYSVTAVPGATSYEWTLPSGWSGTSSTNSITVTTGNSGNNGNISVKAINSCGSSSDRQLAVTVKPGTPATPGPITGDATICPGISKTYSIAAVSGAAEYIWTLPSGFTASNLTTTNPSLTVTAGSSGSGQITVSARNDCGTSPNAASINVSINPPPPVMTGSITGPAGVCANTTNHNYTLPAITNATSYSWTTTGGLSIASGQGTNSISVNVGASAGSVSVIARNSCGDSASQSFSVSLNNPPPVMSGNINGPTKVCAGSSGIQYSLPALANATSYTWTLPSSWTITGGQGTNTITVTTPSNTSANNTISVTASNSCGTTVPKTLSVNAVNTTPGQPGPITDNLTSSAICPPVTGITFSVAAVSGVTYNWIVPSGFTITSGQGTNQISVNIGANAPYGNNIKVEVEAVNACGPSTRRSSNNISIDNFAYADLGPDMTVCSATSTINLTGNVGFGKNSSKLGIQSLTTTGTGTIQGVPTSKVNNFNYTYTPSNQDLNSGQVTLKVTTETPTGNTNCTAQGVDEMTIFFRPVPNVNISAITPICSGNTSTVTFTGTPNTRVTYQRGSGNDQTIDIGASGTATLTSIPLTTTTTYTLKSIQYQTQPNCSVNISGSTTVTVTQPPTATISYNGPFCTSLTQPQPVNLTGTNNYTGGSFSSTPGLSLDTASGDIIPETSTPGTYTVSYLIPATGGCDELTVTTEVSIQERSIITSEPVGNRVCEGSDISMEVQATGEFLTYQWYHNSVSAGNEVSGATNAILNLTGVTAAQAGQYFVVVGNTASCEPVTSNPAELIVDEEIIITSQPISATLCTGDNYSLTISATSGGATLDSSFSYQWYKGNPGNGAPINGANSNILPLNGVDINDSGEYFVEISGPSEFTCQSVISEAALISVRDIPLVNISGDTSICEGNSAEIYFTNGLPNTVVTYTINGDNNNPQTITLDSSGNATLDTGPLVSTNNQDTNYSYDLVSVAYADDPTCSNNVSGTATIIATPNPNVNLAFPGDEVIFCTKANNLHTPVLSGTGTFTGGTFSSNGLNIDPSDGSFIPADNNPGDYTINYTIPAYGGCEEEIISLQISIEEKVEITSQPFNLGICSTNDAEFSVVATGDDLAYQWFKDGTAIPGATSSILSLPVATSDDAGAYHVVVSGTTTCTPDPQSQVTSDVVTLNVDEDIVILEPADDVLVCETGNESVEFKFVAHANGAALDFTWIYADGSPVTINNTNYVSNVTQESNYNNTGTDVYIGTLTINNITEADQNSYAVKIEGPDNFTCPEAISNSFNLDVNPLPDAPAVQDISYCLNDIADPLTATGENGATFTWYDAAMTPLNEAPTPLTNTAGTTSYYVTQKDAYCESPAAEIIVTVNDLPVVPPLEPQELNVTFCLGANPTVLNATSTPGNQYSINWYGPNDREAALSSPPQPPTAAAGEIYYWVSQTDANGCESDKVQVTVDITNLPSIQITNSGSDEICEGDTVTLSASDLNEITSGSTTYEWISDTGNESSSEAAPLFSPTETTTYTVTATNEFGCTNIEQITITVDPAPVGGSLVGPSSVCVTNPSGSIDLEGYSGTIDRWEMKPNSASTWTIINEATPDANYQFSGLSEPTSFRAVLTSGVCTEVYSSELNIQIDPEPIAGQILFNGNDRVFMMCEFPTSDYLVPLQTVGSFVGNIVAWQYRRNSQSTWTTIMDGAVPFTGTTLSGSQVNTAANNESTLFRVEVQSGACEPNAYSDYATLSIIPSEIAPSPVTMTPGEVCLGEIVTMSSSTGYGGSGTFRGGAFDNSSIANHGWRVMRYGNNDFTEYTFESAADNIRPDRWMRTNPHDYQMAHPSGNGSIIYQRFDSCSCDAGNKGFAIVSGNNPSTLETPVFNTWTMDNPTLTFDQAYNLTYGDTIRVELSLDGGNNYDIILMEIGGPPNPGDPPNVSGNYAFFGDDGLGEPNNMEIDLSNYAGLDNLRVRWLYDGTTGGIYTIDDIGLPEDPQNVQLIWYYDEDINDPNNTLEQIGEVNQSTVTYPQDGAQWPKIGWNDFEVQTALVFDTNGDPCHSAENSAVASVYVFDNYTSTATAQVGECGSTDIQLTGSISSQFYQSDITEFPEGEGSTLAWEVISGPAGYTFSEDHFTNTDPSLAAINDPNAIFQPTVEGTYTLRWTITPNASQTTRNILGDMVTQDISANPCPMVHIDTSFEFIDCSTLDFDGIDDHVIVSNSYTDARTIEMWVRPESLNGPGNGKVATVFSTENYELYLNASSKPVLKYYGKTLTSNKSLTLDGRWYHIAVVFNSGSATMFIDGLEIIDKTTGTGTTNAPGNEFVIGGHYNGAGVEPDNYFSGWIEELRIWNVELTQEEIRFMMNQRLKIDGSNKVVSPIEGEIVPNRNVAGSYLTDAGNNNLYFTGYTGSTANYIPFFDRTSAALSGYFRLYSEEPDPANLLPGYFDPALEPAGGLTPDLTANNNHGRLYNITTHQENTSPTPYFSFTDGGNWDTDATWARPDVWDPPNSNGINGSPIDWNIARINHNINTNRNVTVLGLLSETPGKILNVQSDNSFRISHYLLLDGNIDLVKESQLLQDHGSILAEQSAGWLQRDQQGRMSSYNYNYWTSPVSLQGAANNSGFILQDVLWDGTDENNPKAINFVENYFAADGVKTNPITISSMWIWNFLGGQADIYGDWTHLSHNGTGPTGTGYSMKGTDGTVALDQYKQNYIFEGKPHNGTIQLSIGQNQNYLIGNPYPSAIDAWEFMLDNLPPSVQSPDGNSGRNTGSQAFNGALYYWDHFAGSTHILEEYIGGYAYYSFGGNTPAYSSDWRIDNSSPGATSGRLAKRYIPVAQGFFINSTGGYSGNFKFQNNQRAFVGDNNISDPSIFLIHEEQFKVANSTSQKNVLTGNLKIDERVKIRVKFQSPAGYHRQILVTRDVGTTNGFDLGYDAPLIENNVEDMYWYFNDSRYVIQAVPHFEKDQVLPLAIKTKAEGEFTIKIDSTENWPSGKRLYLKDKQLDSIHDILIGSYKGFAGEGENSDRFELIFYNPDEEEATTDPDPIDPDPTIEPEPTKPGDLPVIDGLVGISYSHFTRQVKISNFDLLDVNKVMIFDMNGKLIQEFEGLPTQAEILLSLRPVRSGVYIVKAFCENGVCNKKIVIK